MFPACALTQAQPRKTGEIFDLSLLNTSDKSPVTPPVSQAESLKPPRTDLKPSACDEELSSLLDTITPARVMECQQKYESLRKCFASIDSAGTASEAKTSYFLEKGVLMRKWNAHGKEKGWDSVYQVVLPTQFRQQVLSLAHDFAWSGHLGITKTYDRGLRHFFWPGLKTDVVKYCKTCHVCQLTGKPNQMIPRAPLYPIPVVGEPFERVIITCVGPLPKTKSGNQFLLTIMCCTTRYPEAIPLRAITAKAAIKVLIEIFTTFGLPKTLQSDQGSNFTSKQFASVMQTLAITHQTSSAYHPESQGALERWHQTLKGDAHEVLFSNKVRLMKGFRLFCPQ